MWVEEGRPQIQNLQESVRLSEKDPNQIDKTKQTTKNTNDNNKNTNK